MLAVFPIVALCCTTLFAEDIKLDGVKCVIMAKASAKADKYVEYKGGKVFFCCGNCVKKFKADNAKFATMANHQLVQTGQFKQVKCPLTGRDVNDNNKVKVGSVTVGVCCGGCEGKVKKAEGKAQVELVFGDKAFKKGFTVVKKDSSN